MLGKVNVTTEAIGPGTFAAVEGIGLFLGTAASGFGALKSIGRDTDLVALFGAEDTLAATLAAARDNGGPNWKARAYAHCNKVVTLVGAAVDKTGGKVGLPSVGHGLPVGSSVTVANTTNYDDAYVIQPETSADEIVVVAAFMAEAFEAPDSATVDEDWEDVIDAALAALGSLPPEFVVVCKPVVAGAELTGMQTKAAALYNLAQPGFFTACVRGYLTGSDADWSAYLTALTAITDGVLAPRVLVHPLVFGHEQGAFAGRFQKVIDEPQPRISRAPMRVASGAVVDPGAAREDLLDDTLAPLAISHLDDLDTARYSVFQWYAGREGIYFADGNLLVTAGTVLNVVEWLRVLDKAERRIRVVASADVANDLVQNTPAGNAAFAERLSGPLRTMAALGEIQPLRRNAVTVTWLTITSVRINYTIQPPTAPKEITNNIVLDTNL
jgi:hypothetical protein